MKELTIEQKAKAYDKVREKITLRFGSNVTEEIFSEFEMSEDEKIRKQILSFLKEFERDHYRNIDFSSWIAWLDKLGEKEPVKNIVETWKDMRLEVYQQASGNRHEPNYSDDTTKMFSLNDIDEIIEKISEQKDADMVEPKDYNAIDPNFGKPIDKVKPKFHEGEWVVWNDKYYKVNYNGCGYELIDQDGLHTSLEYGTVDENAHIFSISDAKDGDVLVDGNLPFIFKKIDTNKYTYAYCGISIDDGFRIESEGELGEWTWMQDIKPATKEQIGTLMKAMVDAGWEFDFEKKELKKIDTYCKENCKGFQETGRCFCDGECKAKKEYIKQNLQDNNFRRIGQKHAAWSEEDEKNSLDVKCLIGSYRAGDDEYRLDSWIDSLKDRVQPKQEWNEEDDQYLLVCKNALAKYQASDKWDAKIISRWLENKLKAPKKWWKPSEKQMLALNIAIEMEDGDILKSLYNDLKKLT